MRTNDNQGKRPDQIEGSYRIAFWAIIWFAAIIAVLAVLNHFGYLPEVQNYMK